MVFFFLPPAFIAFVLLADSEVGRAIKPGRTSWHVNGIGRRLEDRLDGMAYLHAVGPNTSPSTHVPPHNQLF